jgi:hypothetical protein
LDTLVVALVEAKISGIFALRSGRPFTPITLTPFRTQDAGKPLLDARLISELAQHHTATGAFSFDDLVTTLAVRVKDGAGIADLLRLLLEAYAVASRMDASDSISTPPPLDALRQFFNGGTLPLPYSRSVALSEAELGLAKTQAATLLALPVARPMITIIVGPVLSGDNGPCTHVVRLDDGSDLLLVQADGTAFALGPARLPYGSRLRVAGFSDAVSNECPGAALEVLSVELLEAAVPLGPDADGDGLANSAEFTFGTDPLNPDTDGDGVIDGVDADPLGVGGLASLEASVVSVAPGETAFQVSWPKKLVSYRLQASVRLGGEWQDVSVPHIVVGDLRIVRLQFAESPRFFRLMRP